jgi:hypothetical protein
MNTKPIIYALMFAALLAQACSSTTAFDGECKRDSDCQQYERCDTLDFRCVCDLDEACAQGEYCNTSGSCQVKSGCFSNDDCAVGSICDVMTGECIGAGSCTRDGHCDTGMICDGGTCHLGCRDTADCDLAAREVCIAGSCLQNKCENTQYCDFGWVCDLETNECETPVEPYCLFGCDPLCDDILCPNVGDSPCGEPTTFCAGLDASNSFCWVACDSENDTCPSGYQCKPTTFNWATCNTDSDCTDVINTCGQASHRCALNQQVCNTTADCHDFGTPTCVSSFCVIGHHCEPASGCPNP